MRKIIWCIDDHTVFNNCEWYVRFDKDGKYEIIVVNSDLGEWFKDGVKQWIEQGKSILDYMNHNEVAIGFFHSEWNSYTIYIVPKSFAMQHNLYSRDL